MDFAVEGTDPVERGREINGATSHFLEEGAGPSIFFVHDWLETAVGFGPLVRELGPRYRKVRVDLPGFGGTPVPDVWDFSLPSYGEFLNAALRECACRDATLVLHGLGLLVGLQALSVSAGEAARRVSRVVMLNGPLYEASSKGLLSFLRKGPFEALTAAPPRDLPAYRRRLLRRFGDPTYFDEALVEELYHSWRPRGPSGIASMAPQLSSIREALPRLRATFKEWTGPVHLLWGEDDPFLGSAPAHRFRREVRRSKVLIFPDVGYLPHAEAPRAVAEELRKIVRVSKAPASLPAGKEAGPKGAR